MSDFDALKGADTVVGDIYAFRGFTVNNMGDLVGLTFRQPILAGMNKARCPVNPNHHAPDPGCKCGFYAFDSDPEAWAPHQIDSVVRLSGKIVVCERGIRAEIMEIVALTGGNRSLADGMNVPWFQDRESMLEHFPITTIDRPEVEEEASEPVTFPVYSLPQPSIYSHPALKAGRLDLTPRDLISLLGRLWRRVSSSVLALGFYLLISGAIMIAMHFWLGIGDYRLLIPLSYLVIFTQARNSSRLDSIFIITLQLVTTVILFTQSSLDLSGLPAGVRELARGCFGALFGVHLANIVLSIRSKAKMKNSPATFITGSPGVGISMGSKFVTKDLDPNPVTNKPNDAEGR